MGEISKCFKIASAPLREWNTLDRLDRLRTQEFCQLWAGVLGLRPDGSQQDEAVPVGVAVVHVPLHPRRRAGGAPSEDQREAAAICEMRSSKMKQECANSRILNEACAENHVVPTVNFRDCVKWAEAEFCETKQ